MVNNQFDLTNLQGLTEQEARAHWSSAMAGSSVLPGAKSSAMTSCW